MRTNAVLSRFERLRETGAGHYIALCPSHRDRSPSLSIRVLDDGRILMHCFAGCDVEDVTGAVGLKVSDLFPDRVVTRTATTFSPPRLRAPEALEVLGHEIVVVAILLEEILGLLRAGDVPSELGLARMSKAVSRIQAVRNFTEANTPTEIKAIRRGPA